MTVMHLLGHCQDIWASLARLSPFWTSSSVSAECGEELWGSRLSLEKCAIFARVHPWLLPATGGTVVSCRLKSVTPVEVAGCVS